VASVGAGLPAPLELRNTGLFPHALPLGDFARDVLRKLRPRREIGAATGAESDDDLDGPRRPVLRRTKRSWRERG